MQKEAILEKSRAENQYFDERERQEMRNSFGFGGAMICCLCGLFSVIKAMQGEPFFDDCTILFGYLAGISWYQYRIAKKKKILFLGLASSLVATIGLVSFLLFG